MLNNSNLFCAAKSGVTNGNNALTFADASSNNRSDFNKIDKVLVANQVNLGEISIKIKDANWSLFVEAEKFLRA